LREALVLVAFGDARRGFEESAVSGDIAGKQHSSTKGKGNGELLDLHFQFRFLNVWQRGLR
jgi:hypothetical protein